MIMQISRGLRKGHWIFEKDCDFLEKDIQGKAQICERNREEED